MLTSTNYFFLLILISSLFSIHPSFGATSIDISSPNTTNARPPNFLLGTGTIMGNDTNKGWYDITLDNAAIGGTYTLSGTGNFIINYMPAVNNIAKCPSGFSAFLTFGIIRANPKDSDASYGLKADLCFRASTTRYQVYAVELRNVRDNTAHRYVMVNYSISCIRCPRGTSCPDTYPPIAPIPYNNDAGIISCP
jgi:hypothetical protein